MIHAPIRILGIVGSLRRDSSNGAIVQAATILTPPRAFVVTYSGLADLPPFNPDAESLAAAPPVARWRAALAAADGLLISSPEYAHGVPGVLKNAFDWVVGSGEIMHKPIALVTASASSTFVTAQLRETLSVMMGSVLLAVALPLTGRPSSAADVVRQPAAARALSEALDALVAHVVSGTPPTANEPATR